jgi:hypothetical protein
MTRFNYYIGIDVSKLTLDIIYSSLLNYPKKLYLCIRYIKEVTNYGTQSKKVKKLHHRRRRGYI